jgi:hypothetical protein
LIQALWHAKGKWVNIYTDSKYAFTNLHVYGAIYKERGLLRAVEKEIKNKKSSSLGAISGCYYPLQRPPEEHRPHQQRKLPG